jgi:hypothetical protein
MKNSRVVLLLRVAASLPAPAQNKLDDRIGQSTGVLTQILSRPDANLKHFSTSQCACLSFLAKKVGIGLGLTYGREGVVPAKTGQSPPCHGILRSPSYGEAGGLDGRSLAA